MEPKAFNTDQAPAPIGPYSQAVIAGNLLFISGQIALNPSNGELETGDIQSETGRVMENLKAILEGSGSHWNQVVKTTIFLSDMSLFATVNEIYGGYFTDHYPARETVAVKTLPKNVNVEISLVATVSGLPDHKM